MEQQDNKAIKTKESTSIPFFVHEGMLARFERINMSNLQAMMQDAQTEQERDAIRRVMEMM